GHRPRGVHVQGSDRRRGVRDHRRPARRVRRPVRAGRGAGVSAVKAGDTLYRVSHGWGGPMIVGAQKVKRVTPTGIVVLDSDERPKPSPYREDAYEARGRNSSSRYYHPEHEVVKEARRNTQRTKAANALHTAYDAWRSSRDAETARALA